METCRECRREVSAQAITCPHCGAPYPARATWDGWGWEYKSPATLFGVPLLHIAFKFRPNRVPVVARGIVSVGQFGVGVLNVSQFGIGLFSIGQFAVAYKAIAQFGIAHTLIAQIGLYWEEGYGQLVWSLKELFSLLL